MIGATAGSPGDQPSPGTTRAIGVVVAALSGLVFGLGLIISGMTDPSKIVGFLDVAGVRGHWDPSLALVMAGALAVHAPAVRLVLRRPLLANSFVGPERSTIASPGSAEACSTPWGVRSTIDRQLVIGAVIFGIGWGLAGYCPGPGLVAASARSGGALTFVAAMVVGLFVTRALRRKKLYTCCTSRARSGSIDSHRTGCATSV